MTQTGTPSRRRRDGVFYLVAWRDASVTLWAYAHALKGQQAEAALVMDSLMHGGR